MLSFLELIDVREAQAKDCLQLEPRKSCRVVAEPGGDPLFHRYYHTSDVTCHVPIGFLIAMLSDCWQATTLLDRGHVTLLLVWRAFVITLAVVTTEYYNRSICDTTSASS